MKGFKNIVETPGSRTSGPRYTVERRVELAIRRLKAGGWQVKRHSEPSRLSRGSALGVWLTLSLVLLSTGCQDNHPPEERYATALKEAQNTTQRTDDIFLGLQFGMRPKEFFDHCTVLNQQQKIVEGEGGKMAQFELEDLKDSATLSFAPKFSKDGTDSTRLFAMNFVVKYKAWAPWNKEFKSLPLLRDLTKYFIEKYGDDFVALPHEEYGRVVTQIKNNRRISLWIIDEEKVYGRFVDLSVAPDDPLVQAPVKALPGSLPEPTKSK